MLSPRRRFGRAGHVLMWAAATALVLVTVACGEADAQYVKNADAGVFLKLPKDWRVFEVLEGHPLTTEIKGKDFTGSGGFLEPPTPWVVGFDGAEDPSRAHLEQDVPTEPMGVVQVIPTGGQLSPTLVALRSLVTDDGADPLELEATGDEIEVDDYQEIELPSGHWGTMLTITYSGDDRTDLRLTQLALFDRGAQSVFVVTLGCERACFDDNEDQLKAILDSLTLEDR